MVERLQLVDTDLLGPVTPAPRGNNCLMTKCSDHYTRFKAVYFMSTKDEALTILVKSVHDFVMLLGRNLQHLRADGGGESIADYYRDCCKTTATIQQFNSLKPPEHNGLSERVGPTIMDVARCMLNGVILPKSFWGNIAATVVFLLNRPPNKTIGGDTQYSKMFGKHVDLFFLRAIGTRSNGDRQAQQAPAERHLPFEDIFLNELSKTLTDLPILASFLSIFL